MNDDETVVWVCQESGRKESTFPGFCAECGCCNIARPDILERLWENYLR